MLLVASIGGGFTGVAATAGQLYAPDLPPVTYALGVVFIAAFAVGIYGGLTLIEAERKGAVVLSWFFLAQIPYLISPVLTYFFSAGGTFALGLGTPGFYWAAQIGGIWRFGLLQMQESNLIVGVNLFALGLTWYLRRHLRRLDAAERRSPEPPAPFVPVAPPMPASPPPSAPVAPSLDLPPPPS